MRVLNLGMPEIVNNRRIECDLSHRSVRDRDWPELKVDGSLEMTVYVLPTPVFSADDVQARLRCCRIGGNEKKRKVWDQAQRPHGQITRTHASSQGLDRELERVIVFVNLTRIMSVQSSVQDYVRFLMLNRSEFVLVNTDVPILMVNYGAASLIMLYLFPFAEHLCTLYALHD